MPYSLFSIVFSLGAVATWGVADFTGGYAARRANAYVIATIAHASAMILVITLAISTHAAFPSRMSVLWSLAAGLSGGAALAFFYRALATGKMGLTAPVSAVLGAAVPTAFTIVTEGAPGALRIAGFVLAGIGIWLISRTQDNTRPDGIGLALLAGVGFAGFFLCTKQAGNASSFWIAAFAKAASLGLTIPIVLLGRSFRNIYRPSARLAVLAGCLDVTGSVLFIRASQTGRLDTAVVLSSLYPVVTVLMAKIILQEHFTRWKAIGMVAALLAVPMIAM
ncbi:MAG TPA: DMT family transporter [Terriglobales bacterium]|nr:DMT family transporter [Terriglobales bacterium]